jgi:hypothetical protein
MASSPNASLSLGRLVYTLNFMVTVNKTSKIVHVNVLKTKKNLQNVGSVLIVNLLRQCTGIKREDHDKNKTGSVNGSRRLQIIIL